MVSYTGLVRTDFPKESVFVLHPSYLVVVQIPIQTDLTLVPSGTTGTHRPVINLKILDRRTNDVVTVFEPAIELHVGYTATDVSHANGERNLRLGYWDGSKWELFATSIVRLDQLPSGDLLGWGIVEVGGWSDPTIGWGR